MGTLDGKVALITGASRGIGSAIALALAEAGADVSVNYLSRDQEAERIGRRISDLGRRAILVQADVSSATQVDRLVAETEAGLGSIGILVNNAGIARPQKIEEVTERDWD